MPAPTKNAERSALATLFAILTYVDQKYFTLIGLAKGLGRTLEEIETEMEWLKDRGLVAQVPGSAKMFVTHKGFQVEEPESSDSNGVGIVFTPTPKNEDSPDDEDGAGFFDDLISHHATHRGS
ncbi:MAG: hypothetical protein Q8R25_03485 [bacterium]|nr:hypothetical protein [bacterium]